MKNRKEFEALVYNIAINCSVYHNIGLLEHKEKIKSMVKDSILLSFGLLRKMGYSESEINLQLIKLDGTISNTEIGKAIQHIYDFIEEHNL